MTPTRFRPTGRPRARQVPQLLALAALVAFLTGCFAPRSLSSLPKTLRPSEPTVILPVSPSNVRVTVAALKPDDPYKPSASGAAFSSLQGVADSANVILDTLSRGRPETLTGPSRLIESSGVKPALERLRVCLDDPGPIDEPWKQKAFARAARAIGQDRALLVRPSIDLKPDSTYTSARNAGMNASWNGTVTVTLDQLDLSTGRIAASASGEAKFSGCAGIIGIGGGPAPYAVVIPYGWGDTISHAIDEAARKAFAALYGGAKGGETK